MDGSDWVAENLQRQRRILEEKQKAKRAVTGGIRPSYADGISTNRWNSACYDGPVSLADPDSTQPSLITVRGFTPPPSEQSNSPEPTTHLLEKEKEKPPEDVPETMTADIEEHTLPPMALTDYHDIAINVRKFVMEPARREITYRCMITRDKRGVDRGMYPTYFLHLERDDGKHNKIFLMAARKRKKSKTANYLLSTDATDLKREGDSFMGKVRCNALGTEFTIYDGGMNPKKTTDSTRVRRELAAVIYDPNLLGFRGPRKMTIIIPAMSDMEHYQPINIQPVVERDSLIERYKDNRHEQIVKMQNKTPIWNEESQSFVLNFHGRVTQASVKNFQIVHESDEDYIVMQFGRVAPDAFSMDFKYPLSAAQAFGIVMTSFHGKLACE